VVFVAATYSFVAKECVSHVDIVLFHGVDSAGQPVVRKVGRRDVFGGGHRRCCPAEGVPEGVKAAVCEVVKGVLVIVEYVVGCLHQEDVSHVTY
jgi:hypothetical protein